MSEPLRILVRLIGVVLFVGSLGGVAYIIGVGPHDVAAQMGQNCARSRTGPGQYCTWQSVLSILESLPFICVVGAALMLTMRPGWVGKERHAADAAPPAPAFTVGSAGVAQTGGRGTLAKALVVVGVLVIVAANFVTVFAFRATYTVVTQKEVVEEIFGAAKTPDMSGRPDPAPRDPSVPRGLASGSLLRADAFRAAVRDLRRAAPDGARLVRLRVAPDRIHADVVAGRRLLKLERPWNGKATVLATTAATDGDTELVAFDRLDAAAPQRVARTAARAAGGRTRDVEYVLLIDVAGLRWNGFVADGGGQVSTSPDGRRVL